MKTDMHFWSYLAEFYLEWEMFQAKVEEKVKTDILFINIFPRKLCLLRDNGKSIVEPDRPQMKVWHMHIPCWIANATKTHNM